MGQAADLTITEGVTINLRADLCLQGIKKTVFE